jgi:hypothetical protein
VRGEIASSRFAGLTAEEATVSKEIKHIVEELVGNGYTVIQGRTHYLIRARNGGGTVGALPLSPGRGRWKKNLRSDLRRRGLL